MKSYSPTTPTRELEMTLDTSIISVDEYQFGIEVLDLYHSYGEERVLQGLTMRVQHGSIYGLLGASGCGKTTLLKCIIGMMTPDRGFIDVFGRKPRAPDSGIPGRIVGYMPQDVALYNDLTIEETLIYFGRLYFMERKKMMKQIDYLINMLDLPCDKSRLISTLSGGQMRRVSFAAALIHEPPLVILDEPTAGVDPMLRANIWKYLVDITQKSKITVIITTHYIEEAKLADRVGLMRQGRLLAEDSPSSLLHKFNLSTLEDVFLALCTKPQSESQRRLLEDTLMAVGGNDGVDLEKSSGVNHTNDQPRKDSSERRRKHFSQMQRAVSCRPKSRKERFQNWSSWYYSIFQTLMWKNYIRSIRHPLLIVFQYVLPVIQIILFGICIGGDPFDIKLGIVNDESPPNLSELLIESLDPYFISPINYSSREEARYDVERNKIWGYIHIQSNFSDALIARLDAHNRGDPDNETIAASKVKIYADLTDKLISLTMERTLEESYQDFVKAALVEFGVQSELGTLPIVAVDPPIYGQYKHQQHKGFREYMAPGILLSVAFSMAYAVTCLVLILEREEKTFERNFVTGITASQIIIAHTLNRMMFMIAQAFLLLFLTVYLFNIPSKGPMMAAIVLLMSQNVAGVGYGLLLSAVFKKTHEAAVVAIGTIFFIFIISGVLWPVEGIGLWLRWFSYSLPCTIPNDTLRSILSRGIGFTDLQYWKGIGVSLGWAVVLFFVSIRNYSYT
jgi:huntingtin